ncbi:hypothetical protein, partial [Glutamicibacter sp. V16R2B1]|uniref:hypothetical protein n=1 Tax=Glutamicibacter sp. V16R2B1 TaxID=2036207 RepID=UPI0010FF20B9
MTPDEALAAIRAADLAVEEANRQAHELQRRAGDLRALAIADYAGIVGPDTAAEVLDVGLSTIWKATSRAKRVRAARQTGRPPVDDETGSHGDTAADLQQGGVEVVGRDED